MDGKIQREIRLLKAYTCCSTLLFGVLIFVAAKGPSGPAKFTEIDAERINIREKDGKLRLVIANTDRMPGGTVAGVDLKFRDGKRGGAGMILFNDEGDEDGGFTWEGKSQDSTHIAESTIRFDNYRQNEAIGMSHSQEGDRKESALEVWDSPNTPISAEFARQLVRVSSMPDGAGKKAAMDTLIKAHNTEVGRLTRRVFVGRTLRDDAAVLLMDRNGKPRIRMQVDSANTASLEFLDENGKTISKFPN
ncbi:MAG TPA: hypothetical protein VFA43_13845 [Gemmatimonadaceae bacterium]|nr:hypothetical protein [Gemmatimonadaceae bacterium]